MTPLSYRLHALHKTLEGTDHPHRNEQFEFINDRVEAFQARNVISVDTKKKELVGDFKNARRECSRSVSPSVRVHDFIDPDLAKANPYGIYDLGRNEGWVNVGIEHDTGRKMYPDASELLITADAGGSNGYRSRLFKIELQKFADRTGLTISVSHFPPGSSKWNKIEAACSATSPNLAVRTKSSDRHSFGEPRGRGRSISRHTPRAASSHTAARVRTFHESLKLTPRRAIARRAGRACRTPR